MGNLNHIIQKVGLSLCLVISSWFSFPVNAQLSDPAEIGAMVKPILAKCDACHDEHSDVGIPSFVIFPIGGSQERMLFYVQKIQLMLDLNGDGSKANMPPPESDWQPTTEQRSLLKAWVDDYLKP